MAANILETKKIIFTSKFNNFEHFYMRAIEQRGLYCMATI